MTQAPPKTLHVVFSPSAGPSLRKALKLAGRTDTVAACLDNFSWGPINPGHASDRVRWIDEVLNLDPWDWETEGEAFWREALDGRYRLVAWTSTRVAMERAGFLTWLWRLGDTPCEVIDPSGARVGPYRAILGLLDENKILESGLIDSARPLSPEDRARHHDTWRRLREENAPLRILQNRELASAPLEVFDLQLLSHVEADWKRASRVVGATLADAHDDDIYQVGDLVLASRLEALIAAGAIEARPAADPKGREGLWADEIRLPPRR